MSRLKDQVRSVLVWQSIVADIKDPHRPRPVPSPAGKPQSETTPLMPCAAW